MGSSSYNYRESKTRKRKEPKERTPMEEMINKMKDVEERRKALASAREGLADAEHQYMDAEEELRRSEAEVKAQISKLDPESQAMLRTMLSRLDGKNKDRNRDEER